MAVTSNGAAPYAPSSAVLEIIHRFRDRGLETPFTNDVLTRAGVTESLAPRTLQALKLLDFIDDDGNPTEGLQALAEAPSDEYPQRFSEMIEAAYEPIFRFADPRTDTVERVEDAFRQCTPRGQRGRMVSLFYGLCEEAGMIEEVPTRQSQESNSRPRAERKSADRSTASTRPPSAKHMSQTSIPGLPSPVIGMLNALPESWGSKSERDDWLALFTAALDYSIKVETNDNSQVSDLEESE